MKRLIPLLLLLALVSSACGMLMFESPYDEMDDKSERDEMPASSTTSTEGEPTGDMVGGTTGSTGGSGFSADMPLPEVEESRALGDAEYAVGEDGTGLAFAPSLTGEGTSGGGGDLNYQEAILKAGEIDDNADWDNYLTYRKESLESFAQYVHDVDVSGRQIITVTDGLLPVLGANVSIFADGELISSAHTYANGQTLFFPNANFASKGKSEFLVEIEKNGTTQSFEMNLRQAGPRWEFAIDADVPRENVKLDVLFLLDATGSMADEIAQLQGNILSISQQIDSMGSVDVRYGLVHYRDFEDEYVTRVHEFTPDVTRFQNDLNAVVADGGGDTPEALNEGLYDALHKVEWRGNDTIKLIFIVADAQPHLDYNNHADYAVEMLYAADHGIKIHPIASSGLDGVGEYIFRQIGQTTMGHFIFLTYAGATGGEAGDTRTDLEAGSEEYTVDFLDGLVVRLIEEEIKAFSGQG